MNITLPTALILMEQQADQIKRLNERRKEDSATLVNALPDPIRNEIEHLNHCIRNQENVVLAQKAEIERLKADRATAERNENAAMVAIDKKDIALREALDAMELHAKTYPHMQKGYTADAITTIKEAL